MTTLEKKLLSIRRAALRKIFISIKNTFPFSSKKEFLYFNSQYKKYYHALKNVSDVDIEFFDYAERFLASLKNSHTKLGNYPGKQFFSPKSHHVRYLNNKFYLQQNKRFFGEIIAIDNKKPIQILRSHIGRISSSTRQYSIYKALLFMLADRYGTPINITIKIDEDKIRNLGLRRVKIVQKPLKKIVEWKTLNKNVGYLLIRSWSGENTTASLDRAMNYFSRVQIKTLIIDIRNNGGGDSRIAKHLAGKFFNKKVLFGITKRRAPGNSLKLETAHSYVEPQKSYINTPIILLVDSACLSSNEYFIAGLKDNKRAIIIGETTGGGSGNPKKFIIPYKNDFFELFVSSWIYYRSNEQPLEGRGIKPHIKVKETISNMAKGSDAVLRTALKEASNLGKLKEIKRGRAL